MTPVTKHRIANAVILVGVVPFVLWVALVQWIRFARPYGGTGLSDSMFLLAVGGMLYAIAAILGAPGMLWAYWLRRRTPPNRKWLSRAPSMLGVVVLSLPVVVFGAIYLRAWVQ